MTFIHLAQVVALRTGKNSLSPGRKYFVVGLKKIVDHWNKIIGKGSKLSRQIYGIYPSNAYFIKKYIYHDTHLLVSPPCRGRGACEFQ
jgi:hypothetical protein